MTEQQESLLPEYGSEAFIEILKQCVKAPSSFFQNETEREQCHELVDRLRQWKRPQNGVDDDTVDGEQLLVHAANTSYAYWYLSTVAASSSSSSDGTTTLSLLVDEDDKIRAAMKEARRHLAGANGDMDKALESLITCATYRYTHKIDLLRTCFDPTHVYLNEDDELKAKEMAELVRADLNKQYHILRGQDNVGRVIMIKYPRTRSGTTEESYVLSQMYMAERSTSATEILTRGTYERSVAVYDYIGFDRSMSPPFQLQVAAAVEMQKTYPERLQTLVMVEPPFWLRGVLSLLGPFLADSITERIRMASGLEERHDVFSNTIHIQPDQATSLMRTDAMLTNPISLDHFLVDVPFCYIYDSIPCKRDVTPAEEQLHTIAHTMPDEGPSIASQASTTASNLWGSLATSFSSFNSSEEEKK